MKTELLNRMADVVEATMSHFKTDFYNWDRSTIMDAQPKDFPMVWIVKESGTHLLIPNRFGKGDMRLAVAEHLYEQPIWNEYVFKHSLTEDSRAFIVNENGITEVSHTEAYVFAQTMIQSIVNSYIFTNGTPKRQELKIPISFNGLSISAIKGIIKECHLHNDNSFLDCLKGMQRGSKHFKDTKVELNYSIDDNVFYFSKTVNGKPSLYGAIKFHGWPETGYQPNGSVQLNPRYGWSSHT